MTCCIDDFETVDHPTHLNSFAYSEFHESGFAKSSLYEFNYGRVLININRLQHVLRWSDPSHFHSNEHDHQRKYPVDGLGREGVHVYRLSFHR